MTSENNFWYTKVTSNGKLYNNKELDSECDDELDSDDKST
jgi:hypothetical protein